MAFSWSSVESYNSTLNLPREESLNFASYYNARRGINFPFLGSGHRLNDSDVVVHATGAKYRQTPFARETNKQKKGGEKKRREDRRVVVILRTSAQPLLYTNHDRNNKAGKNDVNEEQRRRRREEYGAGLTTDENNKNRRGPS